MNPIVFALRRLSTVMVGVLAVVMRDAAPEVDIQFAFDQSPVVQAAVCGSR